MDMRVKISSESTPSEHFPISPFTLHSSPRRSGFTLIEMLVVIAIITMLAGMIVGIVNVVNRNKELAQCRAEMQQILFLLDEYQLKIGKYPQGSGTDASSIKSTLEGLLGTTQVSAKTDFLDVWGTPFQYIRRNDTSCTLYSKGPDTLSGTEESDIDNVMPTE